jgi:hypothetical protein
MVNLTVAVADNGFVYFGQHLNGDTLKVTLIVLTPDGFVYFGQPPAVGSWSELMPGSIAFAA